MILIFDVIVTLCSFEFIKKAFSFLILLLIGVVSQEGSHGLTLTILFGMCSLAISVMWVVMFAAYVFMLSCFRSFQYFGPSVLAIDSHLYQKARCDERKLKENFC